MSATIQPTSPGGWVHVDPERMGTILSCGICLEAYSVMRGRAPRVLPCGHTFCTACITRTIDAQGVSIICPKCRVEADTPAGVNTFEKNFSLIEMIEEMQRHNNECGALVAAAEKQNLVPCSKCSEMWHETKLRICRTCEVPCHSLWDNIMTLKLSDLLCAECSLEWHSGHELVKVDLELRRQRDLAAQRLAVVKDGLGQVARSVDEGVVKVLENLSALNEAYDALKSSGIDDMQKRLSTATIMDCKNLTADAENKLSCVQNLGAEFTSLLAQFINGIKEQKYNLCEYDELLAGRVGLLDEAAGGGA